MGIDVKKHINIWHQVPIEPERPTSAVLYDRQQARERTQYMSQLIERQKRYAMKHVKTRRKQTEEPAK